jgi:hypothetical protein
METQMDDPLQNEAVALDPLLSAEEKAKRLRDALQEQVESSEAKENAELDSAASAPDRASADVASHEREMSRRGFQKQGPP